jgi:ATP-dependent Clp protease ATP-binding subunit ClpC
MLYYDLKKEFKRKSIGNCIARDLELRRIARSLKRQYNNNILLTGASGSGKSTVMEGFAYQISKGLLPGFENSNLIKLDNADLKKLLEQIGNQEVISYLQTAFANLPKDTIIFIDDLDTVIPEHRFFELNKIFESFFSHPKQSLFISLSETRYQKLQEENPAFFQNFETIQLKENDIKESIEILDALSPAFEKEYSIKVPTVILKDIVELSKKINTDKKLPLRAIHLLDESLAFAKINNKPSLSKNDIQEIFSEKTGIPSTSINDKDASILKNLAKDLRKNLIGQPKAIQVVSDVIQRGRMGLRNPNRPTGSFLFLGPSGVGKTELAKLLAKHVYGSERAFTRIDMSEFGEQHTVQRLIGAPPGYVGYEAGGQLTNAIKQQPYSLVLLDEIEKANSKIFDIFLQVFDDGRLSDGQGQSVDFSNSIIVATSNLGINEIVDAFEKGELNDTFTETTLMPILMQNFRTEFLNRFDAIIVFNPLSVEDLLEVAYLEIKKIEDRTIEHKIKFNIEPEVLKGRIQQIVDYRFGARPVKRFIEQTCENLIAQKILSGHK